MAYIDVDKARKHLRVDCLAKYPTTYIDGLLAAAEELTRIPTADVAEVVRCKDCRFNVSNMENKGFDTTDYSGDDIVCSIHMSDGFKETDFCSYGQRSDT